LTPGSWKKNLYILFAVEFVAMIAFNFMVFMPLFVQQLGNYTPKEAAFWNGVGSGGFGIGMFIGSLVWGIAADRWGRKLNVIRVMLLGAALLVLQGAAPNIYVLTAGRWGQGLFTGSVAAVLAMSTAVVPRDKIPFASGLITAGVSGGSSLGSVIGGFLGDHIGYRNVFYLSGAILLACGLIVLWLVKEKFEPPPRREAASVTSMLRLAVSRDMLPVLTFLFVLSLAPSIAGPIVPLFIKELNPAGQAATAAGLIFGITGVVYTLSTLVFARISESINLKKILVFSLLVGGLLTLPPMWATSVVQLFIFFIAGSLFGGGAAVSSNAVVGLSVARGKEGMAYGLANAAGSLSGGIGPLIGGSLASIWGFRPMFAIQAGLYLLVTIYVVKFLPKRLFSAAEG